MHKFLKAFKTPFPSLVLGVLWVLFLPVYVWAKTKGIGEDVPTWTHLGLAVLCNGAVVIWRAAIIQTEVRIFKEDYAKFKEQSATKERVDALGSLLDQKITAIHDKIDIIKR